MGQFVPVSALSALSAVAARQREARAAQDPVGFIFLEKLCVMELFHPRSGKVVARQVPDPSALQKQLLDGLKLELPATVPEGRVRVGTRKKINEVRKTREK